jgi:hypothetical protein
VWIYVWRNHAHSRLRNALFIVNTLALVGYLALPTAPPRRRAAFAIGLAAVCREVWSAASRDAREHADNAALTSLQPPF